MKYMIASDIHGSAYYCKKMVEAYAEEGADRLILLGDLLYHGPRNDLPKEYAPKEVIAMLNGLKDQILAVRGNCDAEVDQMVLEFPIMADYALIEVDGFDLFVTHGHLYDEANPPLLRAGSVLLNGHFHVTPCHVHENFVYMNPGSISLPKEETPHAYLIYENHQFTWKNLETKEVFQSHHHMP